ncbi:MAG: PTS sugar transporter subunit IIA [Planctomycetota bacterium]|nr:PTS sugar transporter subunit IIA [Planctomycetota bacterium]
MTANLDTAQRFGQTLRMLRASAELSLRELARRVGVTPGYLSQVECGHLAPPTKERLHKIARVLGVSPQDFLRMSGRLDPALVQFLLDNPQCQELLKTIRDLKLDSRQLANLTNSLKTQGADCLSGGEAEDLVKSDLSSILNGKLLFSQLNKRTRNTLLSFLLEAVEVDLDEDEKGCFSRESALQALLNRERKSSTIVGEGIALPHARLACLKRTRLSLAVLSRGINFDPGTDQKVRIVALILAPEGDSNEHIHALAEIAARLNRDEIRAELIRATSSEDIATLLGASFL